MKSRMAEPASGGIANGGVNAASVNFTQVVSDDHEA